MNASSSEPAHILYDNPSTKRRFHESWKENLDDSSLTGNNGVDPDITRMMVVEEERMVENTVQYEEAEFSAREEFEETAKLLLAGGVAGAVSKTATAPLARLTILYQVRGISSMPQSALPNAAGLRVGEALQSIIRTEGLRSLWKGNGVTIVHRIPYSAANFWTYEKINELWKEYIPSQGPLASGDVTRRLVAGGTAGLFACSLSYPLDLVRTRLAAQTTYVYYKGIGHALSTIVKEEGVLGLYSGLGATLMQVAPSLAINYAAYETTRSAWLEYRGETTPTVGMSLTCGSIAGLISSTATFPLDLVRRRLQLQGQTRSSKVYRSYVGAFHDIIKTEGWRGLYAGILPEYYKVIPGVAIAFCAYEIMKHSLNVQTNSTSR